MLRKTWTRRRFVLGQLLIGAGCHGCAAVPSWPRRTAPRAPFGPAPDDEPASASDRAKITEELVAQHNRIRSETKLPSLSPSKRLQEAAEDHVRDMASRHKMSHTGSNGSTTSSRITAKGYRMKRCGENVAFGPKTVQGVMKGWMDSPPHKHNILGNFSQIGAAYANAEDGTAFWCVTFGLPARAR
jgi:uncharacterized protein YkwD